MHQRKHGSFSGPYVMSNDASLYFQQYLFQSASHPSMLRMDAARCRKVTFRRLSAIKIIARENVSVVSDPTKVVDFKSVPKLSVG